MAKDIDEEDDKEYKERILTRAIARAVGELERLRAENAQLRIKLRWSEGRADLYQTLHRRRIQSTYE